MSQPASPYKLRSHLILKGIIGGVLIIMVTAGLLNAAGFDVLAYLPAASPCPFLMFTGSPCPGCGMTRAFLSMGQLRFHAALQFNPLAPILAMFMVLVFFKRKPTTGRQRKLTTLLLASVLVFWLARAGVLGQGFFS